MDNLVKIRRNRIAQLKDELENFIEEGVFDYNSYREFEFKICHVQYAAVQLGHNFEVNDETEAKAKYGIKDPDDLRRRLHERRYIVSIEKALKAENGDHFGLAIHAAHQSRIGLECIAKNLEKEQVIALINKCYEFFPDNIGWFLEIISDTNKYNTYGHIPDEVKREFDEQVREEQRAATPTNVPTKGQIIGKILNLLGDRISPSP